MCSGELNCKLVGTELLLSLDKSNSSPLLPNTFKERIKIIQIIQVNNWLDFIMFVMCVSLRSNDRVNERSKRIAPCFNCFLVASCRNNGKFDILYNHSIMEWIHLVGTRLKYFDLFTLSTTTISNHIKLREIWFHPNFTLFFVFTVSTTDFVIQISILSYFQRIGNVVIFSYYTNIKFKWKRHWLYNWQKGPPKTLIFLFEIQRNDWIRRNDFQMSLFSRLSLSIFL